MSSTYEEEEEAPLIIPKKRPLIFKERVHRDDDPFPLIRFLFPRLYALLRFIFGRLFGEVSRGARPRYRITRIDRTETGGWEIFEYEY